MEQNINPSPEISSPSKTAEKNVIETLDGAHAVTKRLKTELRLLMMGGVQGISAFPEGESIFKWIGTIDGPSDTVYEGFRFRLTIEFQNGYPYKPPHIKMSTPCFHPNIDMFGNICLDILKESWSPLYDISTVLLSIQSLLGEPNNESPLNVQAASMWADQKNYRKFMLENFQQK